MSDDDEAAQAYNMLNEDDEADEWNQEFREVEKAAGNPGRVRSGASPSTSVVEALEWEQSSEQSTEEDEEEQEEEEQDGAEEETAGGCGGTHYRRDDERPRRPRHQVDGRPSFARILLLSSPLQSVCSIFLEERFLRR